jgi:hypothetical protein
VIARRSVWSDPKIKSLAAQFVPAADEVHRLFSVRDPEGDLFRKVSEKGHYAGRTQPTNTRQGIYALAPSGEFLASLNSNDPKTVAAMLERALAKWSTLSREERLMQGDPALQTPRVNRPEARYPEGGLVLRVYCRDMPREKQVAGWRRDAWNQDFAWFRREEAASFVPEERKVGATRVVPEALPTRLARLHLVDNVRGQTPQFEPRHIGSARLETEILSIDGTRIVLALRGETKAATSGTWSIAGFSDMHNPSTQERGVHTRLAGEAEWNTETGRFTKFEMTAVGTRWGGTQYNGRADDLEPNPVGFAFVLAGDSPAERVAPAMWYLYGW